MCVGGEGAKKKCVACRLFLRFVAGELAGPAQPSPAQLPPRAPTLAHRGSTEPHHAVQSAARAAYLWRVLAGTLPLLIQSPFPFLSPPPPGASPIRPASCLACPENGWLLSARSLSSVVSRHTLQRRASATGGEPGCTQLEHQSASHGTARPTDRPICNILSLP